MERREPLGAFDWEKAGPAAFQKAMDFDADSA